MKRAIFFLSCVVVLIGFGCAPKSEPVPVTSSPVIDRASILLEAKRTGLIMTDEEKQRMADPAARQLVTGDHSAPTPNALKQDFSQWSAAALADVTAGESFGLAFMRVQNGRSQMIAKAGNLPEPKKGYHYGAWLVERGDSMRVVSLGEMILLNQQYVLAFTTSTDLSANTFFVVTLQPDEADGSPAEHILEGTFR